MDNDVAAMIDNGGGSGWKRVSRRRGSWSCAVIGNVDDNNVDGSDAIDNDDNDDNNVEDSDDDVDENHDVDENDADNDGGWTHPKPSKQFFLHLERFGQKFFFRDNL